MASECSEVVSIENVGKEMVLGRTSVVQGGRVCETSGWTQNLRSLPIL